MELEFIGKCFSQATSLMDIVINMSTAPNTAHQGNTTENCSGGFMGDLVFNGGTFTVRNVIVNNAQTGILAGRTFQRVTFNNCSISFHVSTGGGGPQPVAAEAIIDATVLNTPIFLRTSASSAHQRSHRHWTAGGAVLLAGGTTTITSWGQGNIYTGSNGTGTFTQGYIAAANKPSVLLDSAGNIFGRTHPQYAHYAVDQFVSVRDQGSKGDGVTDDTTALKKNSLPYFAGCKIIFFDAGTYIVTPTLTIPAGTQMVGEAWSVISGKGSTFQDMNNPKPIVQVGAPGSSGLVEITDIIFSTIGPAGGAIVVEWNVKQTTEGGAGMWDSHIRRGAAGTNLQASDCPSNGNGGVTACLAAFAGLHLNSESTAYLEGTWVWLADHDLDQPEGSQELLSGQSNPKKDSPALVFVQPFTVNMAFKDPAFWSDISQARGLWVTSSEDILVFGASLYSFYSNYDQGCLATESCQLQMVNVDNDSSVHIYSLSIIGTTWQLSMNDVPIINQDQNLHGFPSTVTSWSSS
ncbi:pectin lyase fold/virulence factor [Mycena olivaceomarginata]|nr:pectin lyase fold/virulence factor [Mycena olivaceomarginata]